MRKHSSDTSSKAFSSLWSIFITSIYLIIFGVIVSLGYLLIGDHIHTYLNRKTYTPEELTEISRRAIKKQSVENEIKNWDKVVNGIHIRTGLYDDPDLPIVINTCTSCHSAKLITQNKATRDGWHSMIKWMQATQGLPDLGKTEPVVLDYLARYYAPTKSGRRMNLDMEAIEWYVLSLED